MESLKEVLMRHRGMTADEADDAIEYAREAVLEAIDRREDPKEVLADLFGLEPDYLMELL